MERGAELAQGARPDHAGGIRVAVHPPADLREGMAFVMTPVDHLAIMLGQGADRLGKLGGFLFPNEAVAGQGRVSWGLSNVIPVQSCKGHFAAKLPFAGGEVTAGEVQQPVIEDAAQPIPEGGRRVAVKVGEALMGLQERILNQVGDVALGAKLRRELAPARLSRKPRKI